MEIENEEQNIPSPLAFGAEPDEADGIPLETNRVSVLAGLLPARCFNCKCCKLDLIGFKDNEIIARCSACGLIVTFFINNQSPSEPEKKQIFRSYVG